MQLWICFFLLKSFIQGDSYSLYDSSSFDINYQTSVLFLTGKYFFELKDQEEEIEEVRKDEQLQLPDNLDYYRYSSFPYIFW